MLAVHGSGVACGPANHGAIPVCAAPAYPSIQPQLDSESGRFVAAHDEIHLSMSISPTDQAAMRQLLEAELTITNDFARSKPISFHISDAGAPFTPGQRETSKLERQLLLMPLSWAYMAARGSGQKSVSGAQVGTLALLDKDFRSEAADATSKRTTLKGYVLFRRKLFTQGHCLLCRSAHVLSAALH